MDNKNFKTKNFLFQLNKIMMDLSYTINDTLYRIFFSQNLMMKFFGFYIFIFHDIAYTKLHNNNILTSFQTGIRLQKKLLSLTSQTLKSNKEVAETTSLFQNAS